MIQANKQMVAETPVGFACAQQKHFDDIVSATERKERGHFGTPAVVANFMAGLFKSVPTGKVRILDPGAGVGTLSAAFCQRVLSLSSPRELEFELWENDTQLWVHLDETMSHCQRVLRAAGHKMKYVIRREDFILANTKRSLFDQGPEPAFQLAILNPPYFKLRKESAQARAMEHVVHGQPNIYALFMAMAADLLVPGGEMVVITPRSYFNGPYFKRFRKWFFDRMVARQIHIFESRSAAFSEDAVLQENVILKAERGGRQRSVVLSTSDGRELEGTEEHSLAYDSVIDNSHGDHVVRVTTNPLEREVIAVIDRLPQRFRDLGLQVSTGPVVTFRATEFLREQRAKNTAPLLWMHNVRPFITQFPEKAGKPAHIAVSEASKRLLLPARTYVLLKRFTAKEEKRRLVAGIISPEHSYSEWIGLENHVNYVYRKGTDLSSDEAFGIAAYFNSALVDRYFRAISGNTQVNAAEIRVLPCPEATLLVQLGQQVRQLTVRSDEMIERIVGEALKLPDELICELIKAGR